MSGVLRWYGERVKAAARKGAVRGLESWADEVLEGSQRRVPVAPIRGGFLRDSAKTAVDENDLRAAVSYESPPERADGRMGGASMAVSRRHSTRRGARAPSACAARSPGS